MKQSEEICLDPVGSHSDTVTGDSCMMYELSVVRGEDPHMPGIIFPLPVLLRSSFQMQLRCHTVSLHLLQ